MVCEKHTNYVDLSHPVLGKRPLDTPYDAAVICFDLTEEGSDESNRECGLCCEEISIGEKFTTCAQGHVACEECISNYVEKTLMPVRTVWLDTVQCCVDSDVGAFFKGQHVSACLSEETIAQRRHRLMSATCWREMSTRQAERSWTRTRKRARRAEFLFSKRGAVIILIAGCAVTIFGGAATLLARITRGMPRVVQRAMP